MKRRVGQLTLAFTLSLALYIACALQAYADDFSDGSGLCVAVDETGSRLFTLAGTISEGDEYISADNTLYRIQSVSGSTAVAQRIGEEAMPDVSWLDAVTAQAVFAQAVSASTGAGETQKVEGDNRKLITMYVTHSDESYIPTDGTESIEGQGGIYDVARAFRDDLQALGIDVILDESTHLPHDSGAYRRSRQTAERLLQHAPDAIIDIHRDGIPDQSEYAATIEGEAASQVRLLVGRSNQNSAVNREFAKQIKAVADKQYPGLIKDIFIGKGSYNQDLSPNAILLEFGTHTISKERVLNSTDMMAQVVSTALYGEQTGGAASSESVAAQKSREAGQNRGSASGLVLLLVIVIAGALIFAFVQTGGGQAMAGKLKSGLSELTGGLIKRRDNET